MVIDRIVYINHAAASERREFQERQLSRCGIPYQRFEATCPTADDFVSESGRYHDFYRRLRPTIRKISASTIGCYLAHYFVHVRARDEGWGNYVLLEDDCRLPRGWQRRLQRLFRRERIPADWDLVRSCWQSSRRVRRIVNSLKVESRFHDDSLPEDHISNMGGSHFTLVNGESIGRLVDHMEQEYVYSPDGVLCTHRLNVYHVKVAPVHRRIARKGRRIKDQGILNLAAVRGAGDVPSDASKPDR
ncbi:MAG: hypothetical protein GY921_09600 [Phycisphaeraceae bacterium]|nr:hypothetical protein [Phycisphaeraceae bacterium]MCP4939427.1 hypothetical protein [Phycisphaeraceae bacterium]